MMRVTYQVVVGDIRRRQAKGSPYQREKLRSWYRSIWYRGQTGRRRTISSPTDPGEQKARKVAEGGVVDGVMLAGCGAEGGVVGGVVLAG
jgi:hypothetical protein